MLKIRSFVREVRLHIFIDESGTFAQVSRGRHSISAVGALVIPSSAMKGFEKLYARLRRHLPKTKGEVKGRNLSEENVAELTQILRKIGALFEVVAIDMGMHSIDDILRHKAGQEEAITAHLTSEHHSSLVEGVWELRRQLEKISVQLYAQSAAMGQLVYHTLDYANTYHALRTPPELGEYHWRIDAKDRLGTTPWETWWSTVILPMLESYSFQRPMLGVKEGNYRWHDRFKKTPGDEKLQFAKNPERDDFFDLKMIMTENFCFSPDPEFGLEAVDIVTNAVRRSLSGNFRRAGWIEIPQIMIHRKGHYIRLITLSKKNYSVDRIPYSNVLDDFRHGGRLLLPEGTFKKKP